MADVSRPSLGQNLDREPVEAFVRNLQEAIDTGDAGRFNLHFAEDVHWGSPFGAVAVGYTQIHAIHGRMFASVKPTPGASCYSVEHVLFPEETVAIAYVRRASPTSRATADPHAPGSFDELAMLVLVLRDGVWWLAAAQHVPDRRDVYSQGSTAVAPSPATSP